MAEPRAVRVLPVDDGSVVMRLPAGARPVVAKALEEWRMQPRGVGSRLPPAWLEGLVDDLLPDAKGDAKTRGVLASSSLPEWLRPVSVESVSVSEAAAVLGRAGRPLSRRRVEQLRAARVLRPAGRGRVLLVDVEALRAARGRGA